MVMLGLQGIIGSTETLYSTKKKAMAQIPPTVNMPMTIAESQAKYDPPPETGMRIKMMADEPVKMPQ